MQSLIPWKRNQSETSRMLPFTALHRELDPLFSRLWDAAWSDFEGASADPLCLELAENGERYVVRVEIPGIEPEALDIQMNGDVLVLSGEKNEHEDEGRTYSERRYGSFRRALRLPVPVDAAKVTAEHKNGVVTITVPKSEAVRPKRIPVRSA